MANKDQAVKAITDVFLNPVTKQGLEALSGRLLKQMETGLAKEDHGGEVKMLITYVHDLPDGKESGDFLALDLGGSNFRVLKITLTPGKDVKQEDMKVEIDDKTKQSTQEILFDFIAESMANFVKTKGIKEKLPLGFTFSFPVQQTSLVSGTLIHWTKDFTATGAEGNDVIGMLREAIKRRKGDIDVDVVALVNDTTGTLMAVGHKDHDCNVGVILGTGTNACYVETLDNVTKFKGDRSKYDKVLINTEWGAFGDKGSLDDYLNEFDKLLDKDVLNKGQQLYEKMISGKYLGELVRHPLKKLIGEGVLFGGKGAPCFDEFEQFKSSYVSDIETGPETDLSGCRKVLEKDCGLTQVTDEDCRIVRTVCKAVSTRAARLAGAGIFTVVNKINKLDKCTVAVDGSLYKHHPHFKFTMKAAIDELAPGNNVKITLSEDGSGRGAAMIAAVAVRLAK